MVIGALCLRLTIFEAYSLKDKRRVVRSLKDRLIGKFNVSVAEVGDLEHHRQAEIAVVLVANERRFVESCLSKIVDYVRLDPSAALVDYQVEYY